MMRIIQRRNWLFAFSLAILIPGVVALAMYGLRLGLDFTGGARMTLQFAETRPETTKIVELIQKKEASLTSVVAQTAGSNQMIVTMSTITNDQRQGILQSLNDELKTDKKSTKQLVTEVAFDSVGPVIGQQLVRRAVTAIILVLISIILYISWAFRRVNIGVVPAWVYGVSAIIALVHDIFIVVGIFAILGHWFQIEIDALFVTALLTVLGFSVHDTIVVFDRVRERLVQGRESTFEETVNVSLNQTMVRSMNTSVTTLLVLAALYLFGGESIRNFALALLIGIASGTYSSIFVASPLLVVYERWKAKRRR
jgi:preprotein translocase subunit SecF